MDSNFSFLSRIPDQTGYIVISDGSVIKSEGDLVNHDVLAANIQKMLRIGGPLNEMMDESFESLSISFGDYFLVVTISGSFIFIVKRRRIPSPIEVK